MAPAAGHDYSGIPERGGTVANSTATWLGRAGWSLFALLYALVIVAGGTALVIYMLARAGGADGS